MKKIYRYNSSKNVVEYGFWKSKTQFVVLQIYSGNAMDALMAA